MGYTKSKTPKKSKKDVVLDEKFRFGGEKTS
jgi:hypothetical protein